ncbi:sensor histidine kinase [Kribbella swartbergensis]
MTARRGSLATRVVLVCVAVAGIAVLVAGLVMAGLARRSAQGVLQDSLAAQADVLASQLDERGLGSRAAGLGRAAEVVRGQGIVVVILLPRRGIQPADRQAIDAARAAGLTGIGGGERISAKVSVDGQEYLVEARGVGPRSGFALVSPIRMAADAQRILIRNILFALGAGLLVAALAGGLLGRLLSRPLRRTADVAGALRQGRRDLRVPVEGPAEVAEVAEAVNELSVALRHSEERQQEFLLSVSHELRTPLTAVHGFAESLADGVVTGPGAQHAGQVIQRESQRLERLVSDLLDLARLGADEFRLDVAEVDLRETVTACAEVWRARCERQGVNFRLEVPSSPAVVTTDARRIRQVLDGLAENALRVTPAGSRLTLALDTSSPGAVALQVRDGGPGLTPEDYAVAFERGVLHEKYRGRRPVGSGIGLALAFGLVSRLGGTMTAAPSPEGGAAFTIWLPAT